MATDREVRGWIIRGFLEGWIKGPDDIMKERIRLHITPRIVSEAFAYAYRMYTEKHKTQRCIK